MLSLLPQATSWSTISSLSPAMSLAVNPIRAKPAR
jgi:hypothetical protein